MSDGSRKRCVLILGGTGEAAALAEHLAAHRDLRVINSQAGRTARPGAVAGELRRGGFGGAAGLAAYLTAEDVALVIDATHPFAAQISDHAVAACHEAGVPLLRLCRPPWRPQAGDRWICVVTMEAAAQVLPDLGERVFLTTGAKDLSAFAELADLFFLLRLVERPAEPLPLARHELILARGPFTVDAEEALLKSHEIQAVVSKNSGGAATEAKLSAARRLGLPVVMIERPAQRLSPPHRVEDVGAALTWLKENQWIE